MSDWRTNKRTKRVFLTTKKEPDSKLLPNPLTFTQKVEKKDGTVIERKIVCRTHGDLRRHFGISRKSQDITTSPTLKWEIPDEQDLLIEAMDRLEKFTTPETVAKWLSKQLRQEISADELIRKLGIPQQQLDEWEANRKGWADTKQFERNQMTDEEYAAYGEKDAQRKRLERLDEAVAEGRISSPSAEDREKYASGQLKLPRRKETQPRRKRATSLPSAEFFGESGPDGRK